MVNIIDASVYIKMTRFLLAGVVIFALNVNVALANNNIKPDAFRGELLYDNHCEQCHTQRVHWRNKLAVFDWKTLIVEVGRWQRTSGLDWNNDDIDAVSIYLNSRFYHY